MSNEYRASTWQTLETFGHPLLVENIAVSQSNGYREPVGMRALVEASWNQDLQKTKEKIESKDGSVCEIQPYLDTGLGAIYVKGQKKMWPGTVVMLCEHGLSSDGKYGLGVAKTSYPMIKALTNDDVKALYTAQGIPIPRPPLGICTVPLTADKKLILTVRGKTNVYPDRLHVNGGNPEGVVSPLAHQVGEMKDEILVVNNEYNAGDMEFFGLLEDTDVFKGKPELFGWVPIGVEAQEVAYRVGRREKKPLDVADVKVVDATEGGLMDFMVNTPPGQFAPPGHGTLVLLGDRLYTGFSKELQKRVDWLQAIPE